MAEIVTYLLSDEKCLKWRFK